MSKRNTKDKPITKGLALILAREILGPAATVQRTPTECKVIFPGGAVYAQNWDVALEQSEKEPQAEAWQNYKDGRKQAFLDAVASLRKTIREILGSKDVQHFTRAEHRFVRGALGRLA